MWAGSLECYNVVARLDGGDSFTNRLDNASAFMAEHDGECALRVFAGKSVCV